MRVRLGAVLPVLVVMALGTASCATGPSAGVIPVTGIATSRVHVNGPALQSGQVKVTFESLAGVNPEWVQVDSNWSSEPYTTYLTAANGFEGIIHPRADVGDQVSLTIWASCNDPACAWEQSSQLFRYSVTLVP